MAVSVGTPGGADGLGNGANAENDDQARARLFAYLQNPPSAGNWGPTAQLATASTPKVEACHVYPAAQGPGSVHIAVTGRASVSSRNRDVDAATLNGVIVPSVQGSLPEHVYLAGTTVVNVPTDVSILLSLPSAVTASPAGPGGGWLDGSPWPSSTNGVAPVAVTAVTNSTMFTVNASTPPPKYCRIAFLNPTNWTLYTATVVNFSGSLGAYIVTVDTPMLGISVGDHIFPQSQNQAVYVAAILNAFAQLGPGEKTSSPTLLKYAYRHPPPQLAWPYSLGAAQLKAVIASGPEVLDASWIYRSYVTPPVAASITSPPNILVPQNISFYAA